MNHLNYWIRNHITWLGLNGSKWLGYSPRLQQVQGQALPRATFFSLVCFRFFMRIILLFIMVRPYGTSQYPVAQTPKNGHISAKEQLIKDYSDHFKGTRRYPGTYKSHLKKDAKPVIHPQQK